MAKKAKNSKKKKNEDVLIDQASTERNASEVVEENMMAEAQDDFESGDIEITAGLFVSEDEAHEGFLPDMNEAEELETQNDESDDEEELIAVQSDVDLEGSELAGFESAEIDEVEFVEEEMAESIIESILFASDRPVSLASIREIFKGTNVRKDKIRRILDQLAVEYASGRRGVTLEEVTGGYQLRTKIDNMNFLKRIVKTKPFKLSGPALETLAIVAYKQPVVKSEIDQIRGVESGHLLRALMEKGLCNFEGKAENLPGRPMQYGTTRRFLEIFGLRNLKELPTLSQIDELLPEGIGDEEEEKPTLAMVTDSMSEEVKDVSYSQGEEELGKIEEELETISTSSDFFEQEKIRQKQKRDAEKAQDIRDALTMGENVPKRDVNWLKRYEEGLALAEQGVNVPQNFVEDSEVSQDLQASVAQIDQVENAENVDELESENESEESLMVAKFEASDEIEDDEDSSDELPFYEEADDEGTPSEGALT
ncbi:MAG: SMC-Scp complex subunit ScpB [Pseudobdellovibrio sp.]